MTVVHLLQRFATLVNALLAFVSASGGVELANRVVPETGFVPENRVVPELFGVDTRSGNRYGSESGFDSGSGFDSPWNYSRYWIPSLIGTTGSMRRPYLDAMLGMVHATST